MDEQRQDEQPQDDSKSSEERVEDLEPDKEDSSEVKGGGTTEIGDGVKPFR